jgi:guanylate kinase
MTNNKKGAILIISGPSGCGKSTLLKWLFNELDNYYFSISTTTREKRVNEEEGKDYFYITKEEFEKDIKDGYFLEYANVHGNYYGTSLKPVYKALEEGKLVIFDIDVQGHEIIKKKLSDITTSVFITTNSLAELKNRLELRGTDSLEVIQTRLKNAQKEFKRFTEYDYLILNDKLDIAKEELKQVAKTAMLKTSLYDYNNIIKNWGCDD